MAHIIQEITEEGLKLPRQLLERWGYPAGRRVTVTSTAAGLLIQPAEATAEEVTRVAVRYLLHYVGDCAAVRPAALSAGVWEAPVVLLPGLEPLGTLRFDLHGTLLSDQSDSPAALADAADRVDAA